MEESKNFILINYLRIIIEKKKPILIITLIVAIFSFVLFFFVLPPIFFSSGTVKSTNSSFNLSGLIGSSSLPELGDLSDLAGSSSTAKELALYENILESRRCLEGTIIKFGLMEENDYKYMQDAVKDFKENIMEVKKDKVAGTLEIGVNNKDPQKAKDISDFLISELNRINVEINIQNASDNRKFIEDRYNIVQNDLKRAEDSLENFQNKYGIAPDIQVQAALKGEIELEAEIKSEEIRLELLRKLLSPDQAEIKTQEEKIFLLKKQLNDMQNNSFESSKLNSNNSPQIILNFLRIKRDLEIQNKILSTLIPLYEKAKIDENKLTPTIQIIDNPTVPERKSKPKRLTSIAILTLLAFSLSSIFFIYKTKYSELIGNIRKMI